MGMRASRTQQVRKGAEAKRNVRTVSLLSEEPGTNYAGQACCYIWVSEPL